MEKIRENGMAHSSNESSQNPDSGLDLDRLKEETRQRILVVDDEPDTTTLIKHIFLQDGFDVAGALSGAECLRKLTEINPDLILLDMMMPEMDGLQTLQEIRKVSNVPVIIVSAINQKTEIVNALQNGVDDYVTKPFNNAEVIARVKNVLRRTGKPTQKDVLSYPSLELTINLSTYEVVYQHRHLDLTGKMFEVLVILAKNAPRVVTYQELTEAVWGENNTAIRNRLKYLVYLLRQNFLEIDREKKVVANIDRLGYKLNINSQN